MGKKSLKIKRDKIREFVAQYDSEDNLYYQHLAVEEVKIYCNFPHHDDINNIALVDVPGLGDKRLGDEERLIKTIEQDVDFVIFIRSPEVLGSVIWNEDDTNLYETVNHHLDNLQNRSFMLLNRIDAGINNEKGNKSLCEKFAQPAEKNHLKMAKIPMFQILLAWR